MVDRVEVNTDPNAGGADDRKAHDDAMAAKAAEGVNGMGEEQPKDEAPAKAERPEWLPEKFWDAESGSPRMEEMAKSYAELEKARADAGETPAETPAAESTGDEAQDSAIAAAEAEFAKDGKLSAERYDELAKVGISKAMVDNYISGQQAIATQLTNAAYGAAGGEAEFKAAQEWAAANLSDAEIDAIDVLLSSDNPATVAEGAKNLYAKYSADADVTPDNPIIGNGGRTANSGAHFKSGAEMQAAIADPRYKSDPAYREEVISKIDRAEKAGVNLFA